MKNTLEVANKLKKSYNLSPSWWLFTTCTWIAAHYPAIAWLLLQLSPTPTPTLPFNTYPPLPWLYREMLQIYYIQFYCIYCCHCCYCCCSSECWCYYNFGLSYIQIVVNNSFLTPFHQMPRHCNQFSSNRYNRILLIEEKMQKIAGNCLENGKTGLLCWMIRSQSVFLLNSFPVGPSTRKDL